MNAQCYLTRVESFSACHRLHSVHLNNEENVEIFQKCNNPMGHGHNYKLEVTIRGPIDQRTGMVINIADLKLILKKNVLDLLDHKNIDEDVEYFKRNNIVSTTENLAVFIWSQLADAIPNKLLYKVKVWETEKNIVTYKGE
ncbi:unnamed protein product [Trichobilharzia regenti]|uniref:6-pyruvoyl tetrahydrobiopterin synthase n=1 Tax=Trichobilharzia regenti TaxID=157069 RepID=A0A183VJZ9_TRIRE|nr:unnamed protein product [Trichobilharzia regenti]VDP95809.1 unnamed protein product [Trichobilharzia regenti]